MSFFSNLALPKCYHARQLSVAPIQTKFEIYFNVSKMCNHPTVQSLVDKSGIVFK